MFIPLSSNLVFSFLILFLFFFFLLHFLNCPLCFLFCLLYLFFSNLVFCFLFLSKPYTAPFLLTTYFVFYIKSIFLFIFLYSVPFLMSSISISIMYFLCFKKIYITVFPFAPFFWETTFQAPFFCLHLHHQWDCWCNWSYVSQSVSHFLPRLSIAGHEEAGAEPSWLWIKSLDRAPIHRRANTKTSNYSHMHLNLWAV